MPERVYTAPARPVAAVLATRTRVLAKAGCATPRLDAELLLGEVLGLDRAGLLTHSASEVSSAQLDAFDDMVRRRGDREPVAYILGRRAFRHLELNVDPRVLIPRPETELLVEVALGLPTGAAVADVGTGSGAVALALAFERPDLRVCGLDASQAALAVARANGVRLGLPVSFACADLLDGQAYEAVVANLPYVRAAEFATLPAEVAGYEPRLALDGGRDGLDVIRRLVAWLPPSVGFVALEIGAGQADAVDDLLLGAGLGSVERLRDLAGIERVVVGRR